MNMRIPKAVARLILKKRELEDSLHEVKDELAELEPQMINLFAEEQMERLQVTVGGEKITLFTHKILWARPKEGDREKVVRTLKRCGMSDFVEEGYNTSTLSAYVRERLSNGTKLQPTLEEALNLHEVVSIRGRRSSASSESQTARAMKTVRR